MIMSAGSGGGVAVSGPGMPVTGAVGQRAERRAEALVAGPAKARRLVLAGFDRDRGLAGVGSERVAGRVARATVADLGQQLSGADHASGILEQRQEDLAVWMLAQRGGEL